ncbi:MAG: SRPBCC family protein, partial [Allobranchiibius sp.]
MSPTTTRRPSIYVEIEIACPIDRVWELTQDIDAHPRWDLRFSRITSVEQLDGGGYRFRYERSLLVHTLRGTGVSIGETRRPDGSRTSALRFDTTDPLSPMGDGRGYWRYLPTERGMTFITGYDYEPGFGRPGALLDRLVTRRVIGWMTALSFDRLRIWAETGEAPQKWSMLSTFLWWRPDRPRASRCARHPQDRAASVMAQAPTTLAELADPLWWPCTWAGCVTFWCR